MKQNTKRIPVKGTSRRVVIVRGEDHSVFEQIIYVVRDECLAEQGVSAEFVLREAIQSLQDDAVTDDIEEKPSPFFRVLLLLLLISFLLSMGILIYLHFNGWS